MEKSSSVDRDAGPPLLGHTDLPPVQVINPRGGSSFLLVGDHAGAAIPTALGTLGLSSQDLGRHIAVDIGVQALGEALSLTLDATFICQRYSRLVIDCNRAPSSLEAIPKISDGTIISGNAALSAAERERRIFEIHAPYQAAINRHLEQRDEAGIETILVSLHSFVPMLGKVGRSWDIGVLYGAGNVRFALAILRELGGERTLVVGDNEPYRMDITDHTVPLHAFSADRPYVELEIRQDRLICDYDIAEWSKRLALLLAGARSTS